MTKVLTNNHWIEVDERARLDALAADLGTTRSAVIRAGLRLAFSAEPEKVAAIIGQLPDGRINSGRGRRRASFRGDLLSFIPRAPAFVTLADIEEHVSAGPTRWLNILNDDLIPNGLVERTGRGVRFEPYHYHLGPASGAPRPAPERPR